MRAPEPRILNPSDEAELTVKEYATLKRVHRKTVERWIRLGLIRAERTAGPKGQWRILVSQS